jgi:hypothetical protein
MLKTITRTYLHRSSRRYFKPVTETLQCKVLGETAQFLTVQDDWHGIRKIKKSTIISIV